MNLMYSDTGFDEDPKEGEAPEAIQTVASGESAASGGRAAAPNRSHSVLNDGSLP